VRIFFVIFPVYAVKKVFYVFSVQLLNDTILVRIVGGVYCCVVCVRRLLVNPFSLFVADKLSAHLKLRLVRC
jgi:hypothetical protein